MTDVIERTDWLLLFMANDVLGVGGPDSLDPVRIQKGMFLISQRGPATARNQYKFRPYNWGPYSAAVRADLATLSAAGMIAVTDVPGQTWSRYTLTERGRKSAQDLARRIGARDREWIGKARLYVTTRSFSKLLTDVYDEFPQYATRSHFNTRT